MNLKRMLIGLGTLGTMLLALPVVAAGQEMEVDPGAGTAYTGTGSLGIQIAGEPTITCEGTHFSGQATSNTTATANIDLTGCHTTVFGFTVKCRTVGSALDNTILTASTVHFITYNNKPAGLYTPPFPTVVCAGISAIQIGGNGYIGTVTKPACNVESKESTITINAEDTLYTGVKYGLTGTTEPNGTPAAVTITGTVTIKSAINGKMTCQ